MAVFQIKNRSLRINPLIRVGLSTGYTSGQIWNSAVGLAAAIQFAASIGDYPHTRNVPDPMMVEFDRSPNPLRDAILENPFDPTDGSLAVPQEPGLGIAVDEAAVERYRLIDSRFPF